ncbi:MAG: DUF4352 domain-containing protein [Chloroflexi bacterium]|nr:DUF4352 domain-containing protein [Chloroflexota bacterium]
MSRIWVLLIITILGGTIPTNIAYAQPQQTCVEDPISCIGDPFQDIWLKNNGPENFGLPLTEMTYHLINDVHVYRQEFERTRMEYFPRRQAPNNVILARVGAEWLDANINDLVPIPSYHDNLFKPGEATCKIIRTGSPAVCGPFLEYYERNGIHIDELPYVHPAESLTRFGLPLTPAMVTMNGSAMQVVQIFENARLEWYPDDQFKKYVKVGRVVAEMIDSDQPRPLQPSVPVNQLVETDQRVLPVEIYARWRWLWDKKGYWDIVADDLYMAISTLMNHDEFWSVKAPAGHKFLSMTVQIQNRRKGTKAPIYVDYSYFYVIDNTGMRIPAHPLSQRLVKPIQPNTVPPGKTFVGQLVFLVPIKVIPAQSEINIANLDKELSRSISYMELRAYPKGW